MRSRLRWLNLLFCVFMFTLTISLVGLIPAKVHAAVAEVIDECDSATGAPKSGSSGLFRESSNVGFGVDSRIRLNANQESAPDGINFFQGAYVQYAVNGHNLIELWVDYGGTGQRYGAMKVWAFGAEEYVPLNSKEIIKSSNWTRHYYTYVIPDGTTAVRLWFSTYGAGTLAQQQLSKVRLSYTDELPAKDELVLVTDNVDSIGELESAQRTGTYGISIKSNNIPIIGDTTRAIFLESMTSSYLDYDLKELDTIRVTVYEQIEEGNIRPTGLDEVLLRDFVGGDRWSVGVAPNNVTVELGSYFAPQRWTRITYTYRAGVGAKVRVALPNNGADSEKYQVGRIDLYDSDLYDSMLKEAAVPHISSDFKIGAWISVSEIGVSRGAGAAVVRDTVDFERAVAELAASGVTMNIPYSWGGSDTLEYAHRLLDACQKEGIKTYVYHKDFNDEILKTDGYDSAAAESLVSTYINHPAFAGHLIVDEPSKEQIKGLTQPLARYNALCPDKVFYVNLLPVGSSVSSYSDYLDEYFKLGLNYISSDFYVLLNNQPDNTLSDGFLLWLDMLAKKSQENDAEVHAMMLATGHENTVSGTVLGTITSAADLSFQAYTAMA